MTLNDAIRKSAKAIRKEMIKKGSKIVVVVYYPDRIESIHSGDENSDPVTGLRKLLKTPLAHCIETDAKTP